MMVSKGVLWAGMVFLLVACASAFWGEMNEIRGQSLALQGHTPTETVINVQEWLFNADFEYSTDGSQKYLEPYQFWRERKGDCTEYAELAKLMLKFNGIDSERVHATDVNGGLHDMLFSAYGFVNPLKTPISRVNGGGYW